MICLLTIFFTSKAQMSIPTWVSSEHDLATLPAGGNGTDLCSLCPGTHTTAPGSQGNSVTGDPTAGPAQQQPSPSGAHGARLPWATVLQVSADTGSLVGSSEHRILEHPCFLGCPEANTACVSPDAELPFHRRDRRHG